MKKNNGNYKNNRGERSLKAFIFLIGCIAVISILVVVLHYYSQYQSENKNFIRVQNLMNSNLEEDEKLAVFATGMLDSIKEIDIDCSQDGIKGDSLVKGYREVKELEKEDLNCIDRYIYKSIIDGDFFPVSERKGYRYTNSIIQKNQLVDNKCIFYLQVGDKSYWKCPVNNCKMKTVITKKPLDSEIFDYIKLTEIGGINCKFKLVMKGD